MSEYDPDIHHRHSIRLKEYDYSLEGLYFVTLCCQDMKYRFGKIKNGEMVRNDFGKIAYDEWMKLPERYSCVVLDVFQIMPNHSHFIIALDEGTLNTKWETVGAGLAPARATARVAPTTAQNDRLTLGTVIGAYKSLVSNKCLSLYKSQNIIMGQFWQRNYYEHVIRDAQSHERIANYIVNNPLNWAIDQFNKGENYRG
jgi:REP element-mobilizing transposase RayT